MWTDAAANRRQRHAFTDNFQRLIETAILDRLNIGGDVDVCGALVLTGRGHLDFVIDRLLVSFFTTNVGKVIIAEMLDGIGNRNC